MRRVKRVREIRVKWKKVQNLKFPRKNCSIVSFFNNSNCLSCKLIFLEEKVEEGNKEIYKSKHLEY